MTRRDVTARLMELADSSGPIMANRCRAHLSHCFAWAMQMGLAEAIQWSAPPARRRR